ncbi:MAG TPA: universal stress protein [Pyrinomonadaceae bacterium]|nr:universal stress protein [Pyrinomonadaceae bacterium]
MKVLVAVDSIATLDILLNEMSVRSWPVGTEAQVLSVVEDADVPLKAWREEGYGVAAVRREMQRRGEQISGLAVERLRQLGIASRVVIMRGDPAYLIAFAARKWTADLILIRAHNRKDFRSRLLGSVAKSVVESAPCSVEVIRNADATSLDGEFRILLATDGSAASIAASRAVAEMNWPENTEVRVVSAVNPIIYSLEELGLTRGRGTDQAHRAIGHAVHLLSRAPFRISAEVIAGRAARQIVQRAKHWDADLIVLGTNERRGISRLLIGSTSAAVANRAHCSVRVIRGDDVTETGKSLRRSKRLRESTKAA